jgi:hypothetical protein
LDGYLVIDAYPFGNPATSYIASDSTQMMLWAADSGSGAPGTTYILFNLFDASSDTLMYPSPLNLTTHINSPFIGTFYYFI